MFDTKPLQQVLSLLSKKGRRLTNIVLAGHHLLSAWSYAWTYNIPIVKSAIIHKSRESGLTLSIAPGEQLNIRVYILDDLLTQQSEKLTASVSTISFVSTSQ